MKKKTEYICTVIVTAVLIFGLGIWAVLKPADDFSESERRPLEQLPELSVKTILNGSFMDNFEDYTNDQFPLRDTFRSVKALAQYYLFGLSDNNDLYFAEGQIAKLDFPLDEKSVNYAADRFEELYKNYLEGKANKIIFTVIPDKGFYLGKENGYPVMDYNRMAEIFAQRLDFAQQVDITGLLDKNSYYAADTHWQQQNIFAVAEELLSALDARPFEDLAEALATDKFHGVYYGQSALPLPAENIFYLTNEELEAMTVYNYETGKTTGVYDWDKLESKDPYEFYLSGAASLLEVTNPAGESGRHLVIFRDSFGSSIAPLLMRDYEKITLIDTRYISPALIGEYVDFENADVLMAYSSLILNDAYILKK
ncbi:MAG: hypothetical protein IJF04_02820 [Oscillospiraceae bacterium]|nr:hypothetical protein [Oscillospiraceae bacterium]MBQ3237344.1 hypothetical protein [Oscillospiraceae bacterium]MBQ4118668.1 hypothetical protein [Oscillospiraceae bacterium]MBQ6802994.1 hypothetical protein [Oscillospiraceae bacterium]